MAIMTYRLTIVHIDASNNAYIHNHFVAALHALKHDRLEAKAIAQRWLENGRIRANRLHLRVNASVRLDEHGRIENFTIRSNLLQ